MTGVRNGLGSIVPTAGVPRSSAVLSLELWFFQPREHEGTQDNQPFWGRDVPDSFWPPHNVTSVSALQQPSILPHQPQRHCGGRRHGWTSFEKGTGEQGNRSGTGQDRTGQRNSTEDTQWPLSRHFGPERAFSVRIHWVITLTTYSEAFHFCVLEMTHHYLLRCKWSNCIIALAPATLRQVRTNCVHYRKSYIKRKFVFKECISIFSKCRKRLHHFLL